MIGSPRHGLFRFAALLLAVGAARVPIVAEQPAASASEGRRSFVWRVEAPSGRSPAYLAGSIHVLTAAHYPLNETMDRAFERAGTLVEEVHLDELLSAEGAALIVAKGMYTDGRTLEDVVSKSTYQLIVDRLQRIGIPIAAMRPMKPWVVGLTLMALEVQKAGFDPKLGVDRHYFEKAKKAGKEVRALETVAYQIDRFDGMPAAAQEQMLRASLEDIETQLENVTALAGAWAAGDAGATEKFLLASLKEAPEAYERLVAERNRNWMPAIDACLQQAQPCFIVVGAAHIVGPDGLVTLLKRKGYRVEQM